MTLKEFWESKDLLAIHCDAEWKAKRLCEAFDEMGERWYDGEKYLGSPYWDSDGTARVYLNNHLQEYVAGCLLTDVPVIEFDDVDDFRFNPISKTVFLRKEDMPKSCKDCVFCQFYEENPDGGLQNVACYFNGSINNILGVKNETCPIQCLDDIKENK